MVIRTGRRGRFLACTGYPACHNSKNVDAEGKIVERPPDEETGIVCEKCGKPMVRRWSGRRPFLGCSGYPDCRNAKPLSGAGSGSGSGSRRAKAAEATEAGPAGTSAAPSASPAPPEPTGEKCEKCGQPMVIRQGRWGPFLACSGYPKCRNTRKIGGGKRA